MTQRIRVLQELGEQFERAVESSGTEPKRTRTDALRRRWWLYAAGALAVMIVGVVVFTRAAGGDHGHANRAAASVCSAPIAGLDRSREHPPRDNSDRWPGRLRLLRQFADGSTDVLLWVARVRAERGGRPRSVQPGSWPAGHARLTAEPERPLRREPPGRPGPYRQAERQARGHDPRTGFAVPTRGATRTRSG